MISSRTVKQYERIVETIEYALEHDDFHPSVWINDRWVDWRDHYQMQLDDAKEILMHLRALQKEAA